jgi:hypothetical protein
MKMTHDDSVFASFREQNSRTRSPVRFSVRTGKRPASANVRAPFPMRNKKFALRNSKTKNQVSTGD